MDGVPFSQISTFQLKAGHNFPTLKTSYHHYTPLFTINQAKYMIFWCLLTLDF